MVNSPGSMSQAPSPTLSIPILNGKAVKSCHIVVPDLPKPVGAIAYEGRFYSYFRCYEDTASVQRVATRLIARGDQVLLTQVRRGLVLWVFEPEAQLARILKR
ncbi:MAG: hypothetical protein NW224_13555 [Leptolyngbyaceae cyanobacterium bins.302]|nr:hypothetical protein [Leptolyngbyaceae cyanobacterium bins.302]